MNVRGYPTIHGDTYKTNRRVVLILLLLHGDTYKTNRRVVLILLLLHGDTYKTNKRVVLTCKGVKQINNRISFWHLYHSYLSSFFISAGVPNGEYPEILIPNVGQDFIVLDFFVGGRSCRRKNEKWREIRMVKVSEWYPVIDLFDTFTGQLGHGD
jgi:hypothetical protein